MIKKITIYFLLTIVASFIWTQCLFLSQTNLYHNEFWYPYRAKLYHLPGAPEALVGRTLISGNTLSTRSSHGIVRLFSRKIARPKHIVLDVFIQRGGYVDILFNSNNFTYKGLRLSKEPNSPPMMYTARLDGKFLDSYRLPIKLWESDDKKKHNISLIENEKAKLVLTIDGEKKLEIAEKFMSGYIGLEINEFSKIYSPWITFKDGYKILADFKRSFDFKFYFFNFLLISVIVILLSLLTFKLYLQSIKVWLNILIGLGFTWYLFDYFEYSKRNFRWSFYDNAMILREDTESIFDYEKYRFIFFRQWFELIGGEFHNKFRETDHVLSNKHPKLKTRFSCKDGSCSNGILKNDLHDRDTFRFMVIGGSMSEGIGVNYFNASYHLRIHNELRKLHGNKLSVESSFLSFIVYKPDIIEKEIKNALKYISDFKPTHIIFAVYTSALKRSDVWNFLSQLSKKGINIHLLEHAPNYLDQKTLEDFYNLDLKNQKGFSQDPETYHEHKDLIVDKRVLI